MPAMGTAVYLTRIDPLTEKYLPHQGRRKVFISYKKTDNELTDRCRIIADKILRMVDCAVWYDTKLTPGKDYDDEIFQAISECDVMVLLLTENILKSDYVWENEVAIAKKQQKPIIPIVFDISPSDFEIAIERIGSKKQALKWPSGDGDPNKVSAEAQHFDDSFSRALDHFIVDIDLGMSIKKFFDSELCNYSPSKLLPMQIFYMGYGYLRGLYTNKDTDKGIALLDSVLSVYGDDEETLKLKGEAAYALYTHFYTSGQHAEAFSYAEKGASFDHVSSLYSLGYLYMNGECVDEDSTKGIECLSRAAEKNDMRSIYYLGEIYRWGIGIQADIHKAMEYYNRAAELGHTNSMISLGQIYLYGSAPVSPDMPKALSLLEKAVKLGSNEACSLLGNVYYLGLGIEKDTAKALPYLRKAAAAGVPDALAILGSIYDDGESVERDPRMAFAFLSKAAELGSIMSLPLLANKYAEGDGVPKDSEKAAALSAKYNEWLHTATPYHGDKTPAEVLSNVIDSLVSSNDPQQLYIGGAACLTSGKPEEAIGYFAKAAEAGHVESAIALAGLYYFDNNYGVARNIPEAIKWFTVASQLGDISAAVVLAEIYDVGEDVPKDSAKALEWTLKAAELGDSDSMYNAGVMYLNGEGCEEDIDTALKWFTKAMDAGNEDAAEVVLALQNDVDEGEGEDELIAPDTDDKFSAIKPHGGIIDDEPVTIVYTSQPTVPVEPAFPAAPLTRREIKAQRKAEKKTLKIKKKEEKAAKKAARKAERKK